MLAAACAARRRQRAGQRLGEPPGADQDDAPTRFVAAQGADQVRHDRGERHRAGADPRPLAHPTRRGQRPLERARQERAERPLLARPAGRRPDLARDLRFPQDRGLQPGGDAEQVLRGGQLEQRVPRTGERGRADLRVFQQRPAHCRLSSLRRRGQRVDLGAVARRENDDLGHRRIVAKPAEHAPRPEVVERHPLPRGEPGGLVRHTDHHHHAAHDHGARIGALEEEPMKPG
jgi:hypothetical protein